MFVKDQIVADLPVVLVDVGFPVQASEHVIEQPITLHFAQSNNV